MYEKKRLTCSSLFQLEDLCNGTQPDPRTLEKVPALKATLELVQKTTDTKPSGKQLKPSALTATHLLISSLDGEFSSGESILMNKGDRWSCMLLSGYKSNQ